MPRIVTHSLSQLRPKHIPVLGKSVIDLLKKEFPQISNNYFFVDGTAGCGGHSKLILDNFPNSKLLCVDRDPTNLPILHQFLNSYENRTTIVSDSYKNIHSILEQQYLPSQTDCILLDIGFNSRQIDEQNRGFSYNDIDSPLDMRYDTINSKVTCAELLNNLSAEDIGCIFMRYGDINKKKSMFIANKIVNRRSKYPFHTVGDLVGLLDSILPNSQVRVKDQYNQIFQSLRISTNQEFQHLESLLNQLPFLLSENGIFMCIAFHSLEMKLLKQYVYNYTNTISIEQNYYHIQNNDRKLKVLTPKCILPTEEEIYANPRAKSGMLYAFKFLDNKDSK